MNYKKFCFLEFVTTISLSLYDCGSPEDTQES